MLDKEERKRLLTQRQKIVEALRNAGDEGMTNAELNKIGLRFGGSLGELYKLGYKIRKEKEHGGTWRYFFISEPSQFKVHNKASDIFVEEVIKRGGNIDYWAIKPLLNELNLQMNRRSGYYQNESY